MKTYDFKSLTSFDFEILCRDLLQSHIGLHFESFKSGRDDGIDLRHSSSTDGEIIVQCKHYAGSKLSDLLRVLKKEEAEKVKKLAPSRYILATSLGLTPTSPLFLDQSELVFFEAELV